MEPKAVKPPRLLIFFTFIIVVLALWGIFSYQPTTFSTSIPIRTSGQPTIGNLDSSIQVVVFEEPKCPDCARYNNEIFPEINQSLIQTGEIAYTVIPVSFLQGSMPAAVALLCVYNQNPQSPNSELFTTFIDYIYQNHPPKNEDWANEENLSVMAKKASPAINQEKLRNCISKEKYKNVVEGNTKYGRKIMAGKLMTPSVFVNGVLVEDISFSSIQERIENEKNKLNGSPL